MTNQQSELERLKQLYRGIDEMKAHLTATRMSDPDLETYQEALQYAADVLLVDMYNQSDGVRVQEAQQSIGEVRRLLREYDYPREELTDDYLIQRGKPSEGSTGHVTLSRKEITALIGSGFDAALAIIEGDPNAPSLSPEDIEEGKRASRKEIIDALETLVLHRKNPKGN